MDAAAQVRNDELRAIGNAVRSGDRAQVLKWLDERGTAEELVQREYGGRYVFELLQNANDAAGAKGWGNAPHRVTVVITRESLLFANEGQAFQAKNVRSISTLGRSSKDPRKTLGYKGLGFKAVGELTEQPQVISPPYRFGFGSEQVRRAVGKLVGPLPPGQRLPMYAFPFQLRSASLGNDSEQISALLDDGFVTVIRLPFRSGDGWEEVLGHVRSVITPELLLFLDATTEIVIAWPGGESRVFKSEAGACGRGTAVDIGQDGESWRRWLVFRSGPMPLPNARLVEALDRTWHRVRRVSATIAFPLDGSQLAIGQPERPVSVYFPTESRTGHTFIINADFYLDLDRRHISNTPQARPYNEWLADRAAAFFGRTVLPELTRLYPDDYRVVHACAPVGSPSGFGEVIARLLREELEQTRFVPASGGVVTPKAALRSPVPRDASAAFHRFFDRKAVGAARHSLVHMHVESDPRADQLVQSLGGGTVPDDAILRSLAQNPGVSQHELADFYVLLDRWVSHHGSDYRRKQLRDELRRRPLLQTFDGRWVSATEPVFFPRPQGSTEIPSGFPGNILHADCTAGREDAQRFLQDLGVQPFRWREVILNSLLPTLRRKPTGARKEAAHRFLRTYFDEEHGGDQEVARQVGIVPVRAHAARRHTWAWRAARETYFSREWLGGSDLEELYGPLGNQEFLAEPVPVEEQARDDQRAYFAWLGIGAGPRVVPLVTGLEPQSMPRRPEGADSARWHSYVKSVIDRAPDLYGHPRSQQLRTFSLDRLDAVLENATPKQGQALLKLLALHWDTYGPCLNAEIRCTHTQHLVDRSRVVWSYVAFTLRSCAWVPARIGTTTRVLSPRQVWLTGADVPRRLGKLLPHVDAEGYPPQVQLAAQALGFVDPSVASADDYGSLLRLLPTEFPLPPPASVKTPYKQRLYEEQTAELARWVMRNLNAALSEHGAIADGLRSSLRQIPLLATENGRMVFAVHPVVPDDARLAKRLWDRFAWFQGDRGWTRLIEVLGLRRLSAIASVEPIPGDPLDQPTREVTRRLEDAGPYILALCEAEAPSELTQARGRLGRITVSAVEHLTLKVSVRDTVPEDLYVEEEAYLKQTRLPGTGPIRLAVATYYCTKAAVNDSYRLGMYVADFLERPALGAEFSIALSRGRDERMRLLAAKGIDGGRVKVMRELLGQPEDDDSDEVIVPDPGRPAGRDGGTRGSGSGQARRPADNGQHPAVERRDGHESQRREQTPLPPLDAARLTVVDANDGQLRSHERVGQERGSGGGDGGSRHPNWEAMEATRRLYGRRGEEAVYEAERNRLRGAGLDPERVRWVSCDDEQADHDFESLDEEGGTIYVEVKATPSANAGEPFPITSAELRFAARHRSRYFIYRVTQVREAVPTITRYRDPIGMWGEGRAEAEMSQARIWLPQSTTEEDAPGPALAVSVVQPTARSADAVPVHRRAGSSYLTAEAQNLLTKVANGAVPAHMTGNLQRIAEENGVPVSADMTPNQVVEELERRSQG